MKTALIVAALAATVSSEARYFRDPNKVFQIDDPITAPDLRLRTPDGKVNPGVALLPESPLEKWGLPAPTVSPIAPAPVPGSPRSITPLGDGEVVTLHRRGPALLPFRPMPMTKGQPIDPKMPMAMPDPNVDYKLHVREVPPLEPAK